MKCNQTENQNSGIIVRLICLSDVWCGQEIWRFHDSGSVIIIQSHCWSYTYSLLIISRLPALHPASPEFRWDLFLNSLQSSIIFSPADNTLPSPNITLWIVIIKIISIDDWNMTACCTSDFHKNKSALMDLKSLFLLLLTCARSKKIIPRLYLSAERVHNKLFERFLWDISYWT